MDPLLLRSAYTSPAALPWKPPSPPTYTTPSATLITFMVSNPSPCTSTLVCQRTVPLLAFNVSIEPVQSGEHGPFSLPTYTTSPNTATEVCMLPCLSNCLCQRTCPVALSSAYTAPLCPAT